MTDQQNKDFTLPDPAEFSKNMAKIAAQSQKLVTDFLTRQTEEPSVGIADPLNIANAFLEMTSKMMADPAKLMEAQMGLWQDYLNLWQSAAQRMLGQEAEGPAKPERGDRRFRDPMWDENQVFDFIKQSYLLMARWLQSTVASVEGLDEKTAKKVEFYTRQFVDAMAPSNFVITNPEVLKATFESNGENLVRGLDNLLDDLERGKGQINIKMTDLEAFVLGKNIAVSPGKVVYQNELAQLIQYAPSTKQVHKRPLLIVPPWINKFYILDLRPDNSFVRWATDRGHTVFVVSWVNPDETLAEAGFGDYMRQGILDVLDAIEQATGEHEVNAIGYCLGGTLLATTLGYLAACGDDRIKAATYFAALVDFSEPGELGVFIDEEQIQALENRMSKRGYLEGSAMAGTFNMLRANDLIWSFVVNNYLMGKDPFPFDLLYWNQDATRMPAKMHVFYLRNMYQKNLLVLPGVLEMNGKKIDLTAVKVPTYILATKEDHIAPWKSVFKAARLYSGPVRCVLAGSGHIAGVINPPAAKKYQYWRNTKRRKYNNPEDWFRDATEMPGSWWNDWDSWIARHAGPKVPARVPGDGGLEPIEDAPGSYVRIKGTD